jgi:hypothetical protein
MNTKRWQFTFLRVPEKSAVPEESSIKWYFRVGKGALRNFYPKSLITVLVTFLGCNYVRKSNKKYWREYNIEREAKDKQYIKTSKDVTQSLLPLSELKTYCSGIALLYNNKVNPETLHKYAEAIVYAENKKALKIKEDQLKVKE